jgi:23S rRNA (guanine2445-N2)-methyltransferase / 23S rRNA (guanine2069-N7)-methyltransferase
MPVVFRRLPTWSFHILTGRLDLEDLFGQPAARRRKLYNSTIECGYFTFVPGSRPVHDADQPAEEPADELAPVAATDPSAAEARPHEGSAESLGNSEPAAAPAEPPARRPRPASSPFSESPAPTFGGLGEREARDAADFERRLIKNLRHLRRYPARGVTCYRVYERDVPDVPVIIDRYEDWYHVAEYERPHDRTPAQQADWFDLLQAAVARAADVPLAHVVMKAKHRQRGLTQHEKQGELRSRLIVSEGGLRFEVNLHDYIDTGLFLDHRLTRAMVREHCAEFGADGKARSSGGPRVLNLFCYTGSFSVYAAAGWRAREISSQTVPPEYRNRRIHRCWRLDRH